MRLVKVTGPPEAATDVIRTAFSVGIQSVSVQQMERHSAAGKVEPKTSVDFETSTPKAKHFMDKLLAADFFEPEKFSCHIRQPRSVISSAQNAREITVPLEEPATDLFEELWQFSHITYGLVGRLAVAAGLLAFGLIHQQTLLIIAGMLFLPILPMIMAMSLGMVSREWKLFTQGLAALSLSIAILVAGGAAVALITSPPVKFNEFNSLPVSLAITAAVGVAAALAAIDDTGRRELIGLAAAAQIGVIPAWLGICLVFGPPPTVTESEMITRGITFGLNILVLLVGSAAIYWLTGYVAATFRKLDSKSSA
ncbi:MAG: hypothetical protein ABR530_09850 [Pyrinomonadaceae bacterium]